MGGACWWERRNFIGKPEETETLEDIVIDGKMMLRTNVSFRNNTLFS
jgi:hypothetical protein